MTPAIRKMVERSLIVRTVRETVEMMAGEIWPPVTFYQVAEVRRALVASGKLEKYERGTEGARVMNPDTPAIGVDMTGLTFPIKEASDQLLRRQLIAGQHHITDPARFAAACASVGLAA